MGGVLGRRASSTCPDGTFRVAARPRGYQRAVRARSERGGGVAPARRWFDARVRATVDLVYDRDVPIVGDEAAPDANTAERAPVLRAALDTIDACLRGELDLLSACRHLVQLRDRLPVQQGDAMLTIAAVESELDDVPDSDQHPLWDPAALRGRIAERDDYIARVREPVEAALGQVRRELTDVLGRSGEQA
jgi:hypothetical protein